MNAIIKAILERRSVRRYKPDQIADADRDAIIAAGLHAPSSKNLQPWHIIVVQNRETIDRITDEVKSAIIRARFERYLAMAENPKYRVNFAGAPTFVIVSADPAQTNCPAEDCACAMENMFLAAHSLGIGSCWVNQLGCVTDEPQFNAFLTGLGMPPGHRVYGAAAFGHPESTPSPLPRRENTVTIVP